MRNAGWLGRLAVMGWVVKVGSTYYILSVQSSLLVGYQIGDGD